MADDDPQRRTQESLAAYELLLGKVSTIAQPREEDHALIGRLSDIIDDAARRAGRERPA
jgi:hypothetical protein